MKKESLGRKDMLKKRKDIELLFLKGQRLRQSIIHILWIEKEVPGLKSAFTVPKKKFKRAVDRNLLKRRMKEAYRKNKFSLDEKMMAHNKGVDLMFVYQSSEIKEYKEIENKIVLLLNDLLNKYEEVP